MKPQPFMVSVLWGGGMHYFRGGKLTQEEAEKFADVVYAQAQRTRNSRTKNKPPQPRVMIWKLVSSVQDYSVPPLSWSGKESTT